MNSSEMPATVTDAFGSAFWRSAPAAPAGIAPTAGGDLALEEFRLLAENIPTLCWIANGDGYIVWFNRRWHEYCGTTPEEMEGWGWQSVHDPELLPEVLKRWQASIATAEPFEMTFPLRGADGSFRPFLTRVQPLWDEAGKVVRWFGVNTEISQQAAAEEQLRRNHKTFYNLIHNNPFGVYVVDADFRLAEASVGSQKVFENVRPLIGRDFAEVLRIVWAEPFAGEAIARFRHTLETGEPYTSPSTVERRGDSGAIEAYDWRIERVELPDGRYGVVCYFYDLSERMTWEAALRAASERIELALDAGAIAGTWMWDIPADHFTADERFARSFGLEPELCARGLPLDRVAASIHPDDWPRVKRLISDVLERGGPYRAEYRVQRPDEGYCWVEAVGRCDLDDQGKPIRFPGVLLDIDTRKRDEAALRESEARLRALTDRLPAGMVYQMYVSPDGKDRRFLYVSKSHEKLTGIPAEAVLRDASVAYNLILPEYREQFAQAEEVAIRDRSLFDQEVQFRRADGEIRWCRITSEARPQPDGSLISDGIQIDITEQKLAEQKLRDLNVTLEERVAERAAELAQAQEALRQSQKLESMGQLTGGVAHDFNNLLSPIIGGLDLLQRRRVGDERAQRTIEGALASAERAKTLVQRLLAFARRQPLQPKAVDIRDLVLGMARLLESTLGPRIALELTLAEDLPPARADANQLEMALLNLALNARDAMPDGGTLRIYAECRAAEPGGARPDLQVQLSVVDTGVGMDEATLARAVEPFFSTKGIGQGTGLGLSMAHGLAAQLGGELVIESEPGRGTAVRLRLPVADEHVRSGGVAAARGAHVGAGTALLVDDEDLVRASTAEMLVDIGYEVVAEASAEAALRRIREGLRPALLVTDHLMPGMTGIDLARAARKLQPQLPVLVISGYAQVEGIAGDLPRLTKPFRRDELEASIVQLRGAA
ncbi:MAG TPA: PAS domain-containing protein [Allosphingosinicella sp.]|nr:PAS domain-containing protein [Allosphingosinicella sp.]